MPGLPRSRAGDPSTRPEQTRRRQQGDQAGPCGPSDRPHPGVASQVARARKSRYPRPRRVSGAGSPHAHLLRHPRVPALGSHGGSGPNPEPRPRPGRKGDTTSRWSLTRPPPGRAFRRSDAASGTHVRLEPRDRAGALEVARGQTAFVRPDPAGAALFRARGERFRHADARQPFDVVEVPESRGGGWASPCSAVPRRRAAASAHGADAPPQRRAPEPRHAPRHGARGRHHRRADRVLHQLDRPRERGGAGLQHPAGSACDCPSESTPSASIPTIPVGCAPAWDCPDHASLLFFAGRLSAARA